jgi:phage shock protein PspC (stress-responsive transcriptional regulator)
VRRSGPPPRLRSSRVRLAYFLLTLLSAGFPGVIVYFVLWFLMPLTD